MTSQSPFNYDKKQKSKETDKQTTKQQQSSPETPSVNKKSSPTHKPASINEEMIEKYDSSLPWVSKDIKNGKNFYENYAKENDRRKKEGI